MYTWLCMRRASPEYKCMFECLWEQLLWTQKSVFRRLSEKGVIQYNISDGSREEKIHIPMNGYTLKRITKKTIIKMDSDHDVFSPFSFSFIVKLSVSGAISYRKISGWLTKWGGKGREEENFIGSHSHTSCAASLPKHREFCWWLWKHRAASPAHMIINRNIW